MTKTKKSDYKKQNNENSNSKLLHNDDIIINVLFKFLVNFYSKLILIFLHKKINETSSNKLALDSDVYKYLGISLSEIPFIDEDSKANSCVDLNWNPYKSLPD